MSIIYDALKKIDTPGPANIKKQEAKAAEKGRKPGPFLMYTLIICLAVFMGSLFFGLLSLRARKHDLSKGDSVPALTGSPQKSTDTVAESTLQDSGLVTAAPQPAGIKAEAKASFSLNGVFFSEDQGYALINNQIVKEGDKVDGATVVRIGLEAVDLEFEGSPIKLSSSVR